METELKLPYAELYTLEYPQNLTGWKKTERYVKQAMYEMHPGFSEESLWDYRTVRKKNSRNIRVCVLDRNYYIEKRMEKNGVRFYTEDTDGSRIKLFERKRFDERGDRRKISPGLSALCAVILAAIIILFIYQIKTKETEPSVIEEKAEQVFAEEALNAFDVMNGFAEVIKEHEGKITEVSFSASDKAYLKFSVYGCTVYPLILGLQEVEKDVQISCENVIYSDGKENFELNAKLILPPVSQTISDEMKLLELQTRMAQSLKENGIKLISSSSDSGTGRLCFNLECNRKNLPGINEMLNKTCMDNNLFTALFSETYGKEKDKVLIRLEAIRLEKKQKIQDRNIKESLSSVFESEDKKTAAMEKAESIKDIPHIIENPHPLWKKIGIVQNEGKNIFYYRTEDGKIETSEVNYE